MWPSRISHHVDSGQRRGEEKFLSQLTCAREEAASSTICHLRSFSEHGEGKPCEARKERKRCLLPDLIEDFHTFASCRYREAVQRRLRTNPCNYQLISSFAYFFFISLILFSWSPRKNAVGVPVPGFSETWKWPRI